MANTSYRDNAPHCSNTTSAKEKTQWTKGTKRAEEPKKKVAKRQERACLWESPNEMGHATSARRETHEVSEIHGKENIMSEIVRSVEEEENREG